jgi:hypothetical protein
LELSLPVEEALRIEEGSFLKSREWRIENYRRLGPETIPRATGLDVMEAAPKQGEIGEK